MVSGTSPSSSNNRITFGGIASGIDTNAIIDALLQAQQRPILDAQRRLAQQQQRQAALGTVSSTIANLLAAAAALKDTSVVGAKTATTNQLASEASLLNVSASSAAASGSFTVDILGLATQTKTQSTGAVGQAVTQNVALADAGFTTAVTVGTFSINGTVITIDGSTVLSDGSDLAGANTILAKINHAGIGVTASVVNDADGRANLLQFSAATDIQLGSGSDTSNFLGAANLLQSPGTTTRTSTRAIAGVAQSAVLQEGRLATPLSTATGEFTINGVSITWDRTVDSLSNVISRINASGAGVTAGFDVLSDRLVLTANTTGSTTISLADVSGNFLDATRVLSATSTLGANASYRIDGGATQYSASNTVSDAVTGVTLSLLNTTTSAITVTVSPDNTALRSRLQAFVNQYNSTVKVLGEATKNAVDGAKGPLVGDQAMQRIQQTLRSLITTAATGITGELNTLSALGLNFGAVGAAVGTTKTLAFEMAKFDAAVTSNPDGVARPLAAFSATAALDAGGTGSIASISGKPTTVADSGRYTITSTAAGDLTVSFQPDNGGPLVVSTGTLTAGGTNTTIIPGVTITAKATLVDGTDRITISAAEEGIGKAFAEYLGSLTATGGPVRASTDSAQASITDINAQIAKLSAHMEAKRQQLVMKFTALETTIQRLQGQQSALTQLQNALAPKR